MANELIIGLELRPVPPYQEKIMNWFTPLERQLLPKDLLHYARKIPKDEAEKQIKDAVNKKSVYSHFNETNYRITPGAMMGTSTAAWGQVTSTALPSGYSWSSTSTFGGFQ